MFVKLNIILVSLIFFIKININLDLHKFKTIWLRIKYQILLFLMDITYILFLEKNRRLAFQIIMSIWLFFVRISNSRPSTQKVLPFTIKSNTEPDMIYKYFLKNKNRGLCLPNYTLVITDDFFHPNSKPMFLTRSTLPFCQ